VQTYDRAFDALGDPTRRALFELLATGPRSVGELAKGFPVSRPAVSQHLKVLKDAGLVTAEAGPGNRRLYHVDAAGVARVQMYFDRFWNRALGAFQIAVEEKRT
jgi:DNA-binding transcriptional ArsR family regulator